MKINKIQVKNFGILKDFTQPEQLLFKDKNIILGWNYSGKTTLSRLFGCFYNKEIPSQYSGASFTFFTDSGNFTERNLDKIRILVFNQDFIKENIIFDGDQPSANSIIGIGKEHNESITKLDTLKKEEQAKQIELQHVLYQLKIKEKEIDDKGTEYAKRAKEALRLGVFNRNNLLKESSREILAEDILQQYLNMYQSSAEDKDSLDKYEYSICNVKELKNILEKTISPGETLERLINNYKAESWVKEGLALHAGRTKCLFCGNDISKEVFMELNKHFSDEYNNFKTSIALYRDKLMKLDSEKIYTKTMFYSNLRERENIISDLHNKIEEYNKILETIHVTLNNKEQLPQNTYSYPENLEMVIQNLEVAIERYNNLISSHNEQKENLSQRKEAARKSYLGSLRSSYEQEIQPLTNEKIGLEKRLLELTSAIRENLKEQNVLRTTISNTKIAVDSINKYLATILSPNNILSISLLQDEERTRFCLMRGEKNATFLSEGERTLIALIYFLVKLQSSKTEGFPIVFIDDPVSSLDENNLYFSFSLVCDEIVPKTSQIFITTHNYRFYQFFSNRKQTIFKNAGHFFMDRKKEGSVLLKMPKIISNYKTEYNYLYCLLRDMEGETEKETLFIIANVMRRFLEMFYAFKLPGGGIPWEKKIRESDFPLISKIIRASNSGSHFEGWPFLLYNPLELKNIIGDIRKLLKQEDEAHYNCLECVYKNKDTEGASLPCFKEGCQNYHP